MPEPLNAEGWGNLEHNERVFVSIYGAFGIVEVDGIETLIDKGLGGDSDLAFLSISLKEAGLEEIAVELDAF